MVDCYSGYCAGLRDLGPADAGCGAVECGWEEEGVVDGDVWLGCFVSPVLFSRLGKCDGVADWWI